MTYTALITGSTSGIGKAFTNRMARDGHHLILVSKNAEKLQKQKEELEQNFNCTVETIAHDLSACDAAEKVFSILKEKNASVDLLINNAGFGASGDFESVRNSVS
ncbi:MAG: SDR family NAD(P)-dependent oxidoreductase [Saezia sp.]